MTGRFGVKWPLLLTLYLWINFYILCKCDKFLMEEFIQRVKLLIIRKFLLRKIFKGGKYSREETIRGNTVYSFWPIKKVIFLVQRTWTDASRGLSHKHLLIKATTALYLPITGCSAVPWYYYRLWATALDSCFWR